MTIKQAIKHIEVIKGDCALVGDIRALDMAISALSSLSADNTMEWIEDGCLTVCSVCGEPKRFSHWIACPCCGRKAVQK